MRQYGYPGAYFALSAIDKTGNLWYDVIVKCFIEKTCAAIVQNLKGGKMEKIFTLTPEFAPYLLLIEIAAMAITNYVAYICMRHISFNFKEYKRTRETREALAFVVVLVATICMITTCLLLSLLMGVAVYLMGLGDTLVFAPWGGGSIVTAIVCIVGWRRRKTAE